MYIYRVYVKRYMIFQRRHVFQNEICFSKRDMFFKTRNVLQLMCTAMPPRLATLCVLIHL